MIFTFKKHKSTKYLPALHFKLKLALSATRKLMYIPSSISGLSIPASQIIFEDKGLGKNSEGWQKRMDAVNIQGTVININLRLGPDPFK